jgi:hypothetical protein
MPAFVPTRPGTEPTASSANPPTNLAPVHASISRTGRYYLLAIGPRFLFVRHECAPESGKGRRRLTEGVFRGRSPADRRPSIAWVERKDAHPEPCRVRPPSGSWAARPILAQGCFRLTSVTWREPQCNGAAGAKSLAEGPSKDNAPALTGGGASHRTNRRSMEMRGSSVFMNCQLHVGPAARPFGCVMVTSADIGKRPAS